MRFAVSVLDLVPVGTGYSSTEALQHSVALAQLADTLGYTRYWLAEHHGMPGIASSTPEVLIAHIAAATKRIRVGAGGVMLPNHAPLRVAETFHTLEALYPGRIDLGIGRAPGTDQATSRALRPFDAEQFPAQLQELLALSRRSFPPEHPFHSVRVVPEDVSLPPIWLLGSSGASAGFAGRLGLGYAFASHFSPNSPLPAVAAYRESFVPSDDFPEPHFILAIAAVCADTDSEADYLARTMDLVSVQLYRGEFGRIPSPQEAAEYPYTEAERRIAESRRSLLLVGTPAALKERIEALALETGAREVMISSIIHDPEARLRSYELLGRALIE